VRVTCRGALPASEPQGSLPEPPNRLFRRIARLRFRLRQLLLKQRHVSCETDAVRCTATVKRQPERGHMCSRSGKGTK
jgi:hypothetical protein